MPCRSVIHLPPVTESISLIFPFPFYKDKNPSDGGVKTVSYGTGWCVYKDEKNFFPNLVNPEFYGNLSELSFLMGIRAFVKDRKLRAGEIDYQIQMEDGDTDLKAHFPRDGFCSAGVTGDVIKS